MRLIDVARQNKPLAIAVMDDLELLAAQVYPVKDGVVFLQVGWTEPFAPSFRAHYEEGVITGSGPWKCGEWTIREVDPETDDDYMREWARWQQIIKDNPGIDATREAGARYAEQHKDVKVEA